MSNRKILWMGLGTSTSRAKPDDWETQPPLIGAVVLLPGGGRALVLDVEHEYDDGTTLRYLDGPRKGQTTMRDTYAVRIYDRPRQGTRDDES